MRADRPSSSMAGVLLGRADQDTGEHRKKTTDLTSAPLRRRNLERDTRDMRAEERGPPANQGERPQVEQTLLMS